MKRREFIFALGGAAAWPLTARARAATKIVHVGFLGAPSAQAYAPFVDALRAGLNDLGYVEGRNLVLDFRWADGDYKRLPELAAELVRLNVDVIVTHGTPGALAAERATTTIPIVMAIIGDPVSAGVVASIRDSGRNVTGSTFFAPELVAKRIALVRDAIPRARRVGLLVNPDNRSMPIVLDAARHAAKSLGMDVETFEARQPDQLGGAFTAMVAKSTDAAVIPEDGFLIANAKRIVDLATAARIPAIGFKQVAVDGGIMAYGVDIPQTFRHAAVFIDKIVKGTKPQNLPIERATRFDLTVNLKAANALGIDIPMKMRALADHVIE